MYASFHTQYKGQPHVFQTIGLFNDAHDPIVFCCRYDWQREISLVDKGDKVVIGGVEYTVDNLEVDLHGVATFSLKVMD